MGVVVRMPFEPARVAGVRAEQHDNGFEVVTVGLDAGGAAADAAVDRGGQP